MLAIRTHSRRARIRRGLLVALLALLVAGLPQLPPVRAAIVHADAPTVVDERTCTEAQILADLNAAAAVDIQLDCTPAQGQTGVVIPFTGTITMAPSSDNVTGLGLVSSVTVATSATIELAPTAPATVTLDGQTTTGFFQLFDAALTLRGLTLTRGSQPIYASTINGPGSTLTIDASTLSSNSGTAIKSLGFGSALTVIDSTFTHNITGSLGGAIFAGSSSLSVSNSTFSGNSAGNSVGGAIYVKAAPGANPAVITGSMFADNAADNTSGGAIETNGPLSVTNSTFVGNHADNGFGGAIDAVQTAPLSVTQSTFVGNHADNGFGGALSVAAPVSLVASTVAGNHATNGGQGGAIYNTTVPSTLVLANTILAGNNATTAPQVASADPQVPRGFNDGGYNLVFDTAAGAGLLTNPDGSPLLAPHGGPTDTVALNTAQAGNPAIGVAVCLTTTDQRGYARPGAGKARCDIGAYESSSVPVQSAVAAQQTADAATAAAAQQTAVAAQQSADAATAVAAQQTAVAAQQTAVAAQQGADAATAVAAQQTAVAAQQTAVAAQQTAVAAQQTADAGTAAAAQQTAVAAAQTAAVQTYVAQNPTITPAPTTTPPPTSTPLPPASLAASPRSAVVGQTIALTGSAFGAGEPVALYWDTTLAAPLTTTTTTANGGFRVSLKAPAAVVGPHTLIAVGQSSGRQATAAVAIQPYLLLTPASGLPGSTVIAIASGFAAREPVVLYWGSTTGTVLGAATSNAAGIGVLGIKIPAVATPGTYKLYAVGAISKVQASASLTVASAHSSAVNHPRRRPRA